MGKRSSIIDRLLAYSAGETQVDDPACRVYRGIMNGHLPPRVETQVSNQ